MHEALQFCEVTTKVKAAPGYYEIHLLTGERLKAGISGNVRRRLRHHADSLQRYLKGALKANPEPSDVVSKRSILAKHLFFDESIAPPGYDLRTQKGRQSFLNDHCRVFVKLMPRDQAREYERERERSGQFRYVGKVLKRERAAPKKSRRRKKIV